MMDLESELLSASQKVGDAFRVQDRLMGNAANSLSVVSHNVDVLTSETTRMCELSSNPQRTIKEIDDEFCRITGLNKTDFVFLAIATAFQTARWIIIDCMTDFGSGAERDERIDHNDKSIKDAESESIDSTVDRLKDPQDMRYRSDVIRGRTWTEILSEPVPFDVIDGSSDFDLGMSGRNHREMTLGHDPILGWFFGTINILTDTTTLKNLKTFIMTRQPRLRFSRKTTFTEALRSAYASCRIDKKRLSAAIAMEAIHLKSDLNAANLR